MGDSPMMDMDRIACYRAISTRDARFDGRLFVGVKTTGIYCRPICPARTPKFENVSFYPSAAAAQEAGFRPCLRCRPEISPELAFWRGTSNTVSRALALIEAGGLDDADVEGLANRLGVGARQLRRLFRQHVGASPIAVAQTRRVLLAKQLIHETSLPMAEVALAVGFQQRPPLQRNLSADVRPFAGDAAARPRQGQSARPARCRCVWPIGRPMTGTRCCRFSRHRAIPGVETGFGKTATGARIAIGDNSGVISVAPADKNRVDVTVRFPDMAALPQIIARVRRVFDLAADPDTIGAHLSLDPVLAPLVAARPGLRVPGAWDGFELAVRAIFGQQITVPAATKLLGRLVQHYGAPLPAAMREGEGLSHLFPSPARLAGAEICNARHAGGAGDGGDVAGAGDLRRSRDFQPRREPRRGDREIAVASGDRRMDRAIHRDARAARTRCIPRRRHRLAARDGSRRPASVAGPNCCRARNAGGRGAPTRRCICGRPARSPRPGPGKSRGANMSAKPPETFLLDRLKTPIGTALLVTDADGVLRAFDWEDHSAAHEGAAAAAIWRGDLAGRARSRSHPGGAVSAISRAISLL